MIENWFAVPIHYSFADEEIKQKILDEYRAKEPEIILKLSDRTWDDNIKTTFDAVPNLIEMYNFNTLENFILESVKELTERNVCILQSWVNYSVKWNYQSCHRHENSGISGTYYIQTNEEDGRLRFHSPIPFFEKHCNITNFTPQNGKLVLFPSWLQHSVEPNVTENTRISISFNIN